MRPDPVTPSTEGGHPVRVIIVAGELMIGSEGRRVEMYLGEGGQRAELSVQLAIQVAHLGPWPLFDSRLGLCHHLTFSAIAWYMPTLKQSPIRLEREPTQPIFQMGQSRHREKPAPVAGQGQTDFLVGRLPPQQTLPERPPALGIWAPAM